MDTDPAEVSTARLVDGVLLLTDATAEGAPRADVINSLALALLSADTSASRFDPAASWGDRVLSILTSIAWVRLSDVTEERSFPIGDATTFTPVDEITASIARQAGEAAGTAAKQAFAVLDRGGHLAEVWEQKNVGEFTAASMVCYVVAREAEPLLSFNYSKLTGSTDLATYPRKTLPAAALTKFTTRRGELTLNEGLYATLRARVAEKVALHLPTAVVDFPKQGEVQPPPLEPPRIIADYIDVLSALIDRSQQ